MKTTMGRRVNDMCVGLSAEPALLYSAAAYTHHGYNRRIKT